MIERVVVRTVVETRAVSRSVGIAGKSQYQSYLETTTADPPLSEEEWAAGGGGGTVDAAAIAAITHEATAKATPVDADEIGLADSDASFGWGKLTWAAIKATLKAYFDGIYQTTAVTWATIAGRPATTPEATAGTLVLRDAGGGAKFGDLVATGFNVMAPQVENNGADSIGFVWVDPGSTYFVTQRMVANSIGADQVHDFPDASGVYALTADTLGRPDALFNGTISGTLSVPSALTTDATTKTNLKNAAGLGSGDSPTFGNINLSTGGYVGAAAGSRILVGNDMTLLNVATGRAVNLQPEASGQARIVGLNVPLGWSTSNNVNGALANTRLHRISDGLVGIGGAGAPQYGPWAGTVHQYSGSVKLTNLEAVGTIKTVSYTVAAAVASSHATAIAAGVGAQAYISDSSYGFAVWSNGTVWKKADGTTLS